MESVQETNTSESAYHRLRQTGLLGEMQLRAWWFLKSEGDMTGRELSRVAVTDGLWKRCSELHGLGLAKIVDVRRCKVSGINASVWRAIQPEGQIPERPLATESERSVFHLVVSPTGTVLHSFDSADVAKQHAVGYGNCEVMKVKVLSRYFP